MKTILITGGAGFIGANFINFLFESSKNYKVVNLDKLTYAADLTNLSELDNENYEFIEGDICDKALIKSLFEKYKFDGVIHFAAESHVDNSISSPDEFIQTNVNGTFNLVDCARSLWLESPFNVRPEFADARFHHISTDEVYGTLGATGLFTEETPYSPNSPYSASKAASDLIVRSYFHTYGLNVVTTNCSNNYGSMQHLEKLIPTIIRKAISNEPIPIYGDGKNIRDWLFVTDHCRAILDVFEGGRSGETYNVGGDEEKTNLEVVSCICSKLDKLLPRDDHKYSKLITFVKDRPGHDRRYAIDASKIKKELNWSPSVSFEEGIDHTLNWYLNKLGQHE